MEQQDQQLVTQAQLELPYDTRAFEALTKRYYSFVRQIGMRLLSTADEADTVAQDVMLRVFHHLPKLRETATFEGWLRQITSNVTKSYISREIREREKAERFYCQQQITPPSVEIAERASTDFQSMLADLNLEERSIVALRFVNDLGFAEISAHTGLKLSATKMRYYRALEKLRNHHEQTTAV